MKKDVPFFSFKGELRGCNRRYITQSNASWKADGLCWEKSSPETTELMGRVANPVEQNAGAVKIAKHPKQAISWDGERAVTAEE